MTNRLRQAQLLLRQVLKEKKELYKEQVKGMEKLQKESVVSDIQGLDLCVSLLEEILVKVLYE